MTDEEPNLLIRKRRRAGPVGDVLSQRGKNLLLQIEPGAGILDVAFAQSQVI
jgi:hypothetical protein